ncbi:EthD family reductase [Flavihumibacter solisilvae]|uniref:EthD family reductase n=1 Tax=Flavihumibacter solisilvae TaxID=1349421 RepID=UPI0006907150|nr:EthD family reductase [Flavihumibacter solisilvae]
MNVNYITTPTEGIAMYKVTLLYSQPADAAAFDKYFLETHLPLAERLEGYLKMELTNFVSNPSGEKPPFYRMSELYFVDQHSLQHSLDSPEGKAMVTDFSKFAPGGVQMIFGSVEELSVEFDTDRVF